MAHTTKLSSPDRTVLDWLNNMLSAALLFFAICLCSANTVRSMAVFLILLTLSLAFLFWSRLRERIRPPVTALALVVLMDLLSCTYAVSGKFALNEILKVMASFCLALILLTLIDKENSERKAAAVLAGCAAIAGLVSIDLLSTRWISTPVLTVLGWFTPSFKDLAVVEEGVRMTSIFIYPNAFAACMGIGILLSLGLAVSSKRKEERVGHLICLSVSSLAFVLTFSMGACAMIVPAFLVILALTGREHRIGLFFLMVETLIVTLLCAFPISRTSMTAWTGVRPIPLLCTAAGAAALCVLDLLIGQRLARKLVGHGKAVSCLAAALLVGTAVFLVAACSLTVGVTLRAGESLRRAVYPDEGTYALTAETEGDPFVVIESQNRADTMMHTSLELYQGPLSQAVFAVPEGSLVVWFNFSTDKDIRLDSVEYMGENGSGNVPLGYRLLPGFIANRLQGLRANQNAIQRLVFFEDGIKLFRRSPIVGRGIGSYANGVTSEQSFYYYTKYAHSHYIQTLAETGIIGFVLFIGLLVVSAVAVWRGRERPLGAALGAALIFIACHGAVDGIFSYFASMPMIFGLFTVIALSCGDTLIVPAWARKKAVQTGLTVGVCALLVVFVVPLGCNIAAWNMAVQSPNLDTLERAAALDPFEKADYMIAYVIQSTEESDGAIKEKADQYAVRLGKLESNSIPIYLSEYYLKTDRLELAMEMAERYAAYGSADASVWQAVFDLLERYEQDTPDYRASVLHIVDQLDAWNGENMGQVVLNEKAESFIARMRS